MKKQIFKACAMMLMLLVATSSCKTTEANYKAAYDVAKAKTQQGGDREITGFIEREKRLNDYSLVGGDSVKVISEFVSIIDGDAADVKTYGVVVGDFKQVFNARSFRDRIKEVENNTDSPAYVAVSPAKRYYVVYKGFDDIKDASKFLKNKKNFKIGIPLEEPWILELAR